MKSKILSASLIFWTGILSAQEAPPWVLDPGSVYSGDDYVYALGEGNSRQRAEDAAYANISKIFGLTVSTESQAQRRFNETEEGSSSSLSMEENTSVSSSHNLVNVRIDKTWQNNRTDKYYALALIDKDETATLLENLIDAGLSRVNYYVEQAEGESDILYQYSLYDAAAFFALKTQSYLDQIRLIAPSRAVTPEHTADFLISKAEELSRQITFKVELEGDDIAVLGIAIESIVTDLGYRLAFRNPKYYFFGKIIYTEKDTGYGMIFVSYNFQLTLVDQDDNILTSFTYSGEEGHLNPGQARLKAVENIETELRASMGENFNIFLNEVIQE